MSIIVGFTALLVALVAMWMVGEVTKRQNNQNDAFLKAHVKGIKDAIDKANSALTESNRVLAALHVRVEALEAESLAVKAAQDNAREILANLEKSNREKIAAQPQRQPSSKSAAIADRNVA